MTALHWDFGSAYDFFVSLFVIHHPDRFGLRPAWAAGVRSRFSPEERLFLDEAINFFPVPLSWINQLPLEEKNTQNILNFLATIPPEKRLISLYRSSRLTEQVLSTINRIQETQKISAEDLEVLKTLFQRRTTPIKPRDVQKMAEVFLDPAAFGERLLKVFQDYYQVFFAEEEERILPTLKEGLIIAQKQATIQPFPELLEDLSHGVKLENIDSYKKIILAPSYWTTPLVFFNNPQPDELLVVYGCREENQNLVPGEYVPETLVMGLKALADPTRLRILYYLNQGSTTPSSLARQLRLRAPTVIHHLNTMRLAGLVQVTLTSNGERRYSLRQEAIDDTYRQLNMVINPDKK
ncbi:MAG: winged helix-turn-helix transcriptional regulator [Anaerolineaceae bacterium]|nr:winged helix-turn-helix transcriptional regulator [Anaerolineaceae bacterium]